MAITECGKGHVYDTDQYSACPYCNGETNVINFGGADIDKTVAPGVERTIGNGQMGNRTVANITPNKTQANMNKTVAPDYLRKREEEENKTVGIFKQEYNLDPVVGWLVCIEGPEKGKDYHLWAKINTIGRSEKMDVCIKRDITISKENHARLAYDPKHNNYRLIPGESTNNIYVNDEPIYTPISIKAYDVIELGSSKTIFIPLCNERFQWTTGVIQEN